MGDRVAGTAETCEAKSDGIVVAPEPAVTVAWAALWRRRAHGIRAGTDADGGERKCRHCAQAPCSLPQTGRSRRRITGVSSGPAASSVPHGLSSAYWASFSLSGGGARE